MSQGAYYLSDPETEFQRLCCPLEGASPTRARTGSITAQEIISLVSNKRGLSRRPSCSYAAAIPLVSRCLKNAQDITTLTMYNIKLSEVKRPLGRPRRRWVDNIKMDLR
jgi:hypothetical protein